MQKHQAEESNGFCQTFWYCWLWWRYKSRGRRRKKNGRLEWNQGICNCIKVFLPHLQPDSQRHRAKCLCYSASTAPSLHILYCVIQHPITFLFNSMLFSINSTFFASLSMILYCVIQHQHLLVHFFIALCYSASTLYFAASAIFFARCTMKLFFPCARILWEFLNDACNGDAFVITFLMIMIIMVMVILVTIQMIILMIMVFGDCEYSWSYHQLEFCGNFSMTPAMETPLWSLLLFFDDHIFMMMVMVILVTIVFMIMVTVIVNIHDHHQLEFCGNSPIMLWMETPLWSLPAFVHKISLERWSKMTRIN